MRSRKRGIEFRVIQTVIAMVFAGALALSWPRPARADIDSERAIYVSELVTSIAAATRQELLELEAALRHGARTQCRASFGKPSVRCFVSLATSTCSSTRSESSRQRACRRIADVMVTNQLAENEWIDKSTRVSLMNRADNFRAAMSRELRRRYAPLAAELSLSTGFKNGADLGASIDRFCVNYTAKRRLSWQRCVAALVWYTGTTDRSDPR